jgi:hypothetical protein
MFVTAAIGRTSTIAPRRMSLTTMTSLWSQRSTNVPAIGLRRRFGRVAAKKTSPVGERRTGRDGDDRDERQLVEAIAEERDQLAGPQAPRTTVEREPDVRMLPNSLDDLDRRLGDRDRDGGWVAAAVAAEPAAVATVIVCGTRSVGLEGLE